MRHFRPSIQFTGEIIEEKVILSPRDSLNGTSTKAQRTFLKLEGSKNAKVLNDMQIFFEPPLKSSENHFSNHTTRPEFIFSIPAYNNFEKIAKKCVSRSQA